jgi:anti-anti-sigma regulatory factor
MTSQPTKTAAGVRYDRPQVPARTERSIGVQTRPVWGTLVEVSPNPSGMIDEQRLRVLETQLTELTDDPAAGDIVIVVNRVTVITAAFMSLLAVLRPKLSCQNRKLALHGLKAQCAAVLQDSGLEDLVAGAVHRNAADAAPLFLLDGALTARSRGSERAA